MKEVPYIPLTIGHKYIVSDILLKQVDHVPLVVTVTDFTLTQAFVVELGTRRSIHRSWLIAEASPLMKALL